MPRPIALPLAAGVVLAVVLAAGCSTAQEPVAGPDIARIVDVRSAFGPEAAVQTYPVSGIDPARLGTPALPAGLRYAPPQCASLASGQGLGEGTQGNMAGLIAQDAGNRFVVIAVQTSQAPEAAAPSADCARVDFAGGALRGAVETVEAPSIADAQTVGTHRVVTQTLPATATSPASTATGELWTYVARFDALQVIVVADPIVAPGQPVAPVDTARARALLATAVDAVRG